MFIPVFNNHPRIGALVEEYDSWKRIYPRQSALRTGAVVDIPGEFMHLRPEDKQLVCNLIASKDEEAYQYAEAVGNEAWKQGLLFAAQAVDHALFITEGEKGVFKHVLNEHQTVLLKMSDECDDVDKIIKAMIKSTPDLNLQHKRHAELMRVEEMITNIAQGVRHKNEMALEAEKCDRNITEMTHLFRYTMTDEQQKGISKEQDKRTMFLKESNRCTANIVQAVTGTQLQPRSDQIKMDYRIPLTLPENFQRDKGKMIYSNAKTSITSAAHIYYTLIPFLCRMNDFCPVTAVFCKPPAEDDVETDELGIIRAVPYHDVPECMVTEFIQQDKLLYGEISVLLKEYPDLIARLHGEFRYGMHDNRTAKVMQESGINMIWGLMTMFRPAGAEHRMKVETILNKMHEEFSNKQRPHDVIDKYRKYLNEAIELGIKLKWLTTGQRIVMKVNAMDPMFAATLSKYLDEDTELDDAALKLDRLFTDITKISHRIVKKDNDNQMKEGHPKRLFNINEFDPYPYIGDDDEYWIKDDDIFDESNPGHGYFTNRDMKGKSEGKGWGARGSKGNYNDWDGRVGSEVSKYNSGNNYNVKDYRSNGVKGGRYDNRGYVRPTGKGGRGADYNGRSSQRIQVECEAIKCDQKTAVGHFCLRHYRELVTEQKIQKKDGSWLKFEDYKSKFKGQKGSAQRAWEVGEYTEAMRIVENICMMALTHDDPGEPEEMRENGGDMMFTKEDDTNQYDEHEHGMNTHVANMKRARTDEEIDQQDFFMATRQVNK